MHRIFCKIKVDKNEEIIILITALHGIEDLEKLYLSNKEETKTIILDDSRIIYKDENLDIAIIEIIPSDKINCPYFEIDEKYYKKDGVHNYNNQIGYNLGYPYQDECTFSLGKIKVLKGNNKTHIKHFCSTKEGCSGSPIILIDNLKCIGIHLQGNEYGNLGNFVCSSVDSFINNFNNEKNILKNKYYERKTFNNPKKMELEFEEGLGCPNIESFNKKFVNNVKISLYCNLNRNKINFPNNLDSSSSSSSNTADIINNDNEFLEDNTTKVKEI